MVDDEASIEGAVNRYLFRTESDTDQDDDDDILGQNSLFTDTHENQPVDVFVERQIMNVLLAEQHVGGSIAQRLWPAAQYLADFVSAHYDCDSKGHIDEALNDSGEAGSMIHKLVELLSFRDQEKPLHILELGAGVGLTGLQVATTIRCKVLLTDLDDAISLLERNIILNRSKFKCGESAVKSQVLSWGNESDCQAALRWLPPTDDVLILAADCVYFKDLQWPLEQTLAGLLSQVPPGSLCLIAGARRWKSDNSFYAKVGQRSKADNHRLSCVCLKETVSRDKDGHRDVLRVFGIQWRQNHNV